MRRHGFPPVRAGVRQEVPEDRVVHQRLVGVEQRRPTRDPGQGDLSGLRRLAEPTQVQRLAASRCVGPDIVRDLFTELGNQKDAVGRSGQVREGRKSPVMARQALPSGGGRP